ncbi:MAG: RNA methyltransferase [Ilumatobacter sp.]|uniref:TrmH family RNA methyltransferase n=1 Tax=Ilumatobacter sp. TaxID=1967498 RepID=UPI003298977D
MSDREASGSEFKNPRVQALRRLLADRTERRHTGLFVVEGPTSTVEAVRSGARCLTQFVPIGSDAAVDGAGDVVELAEGVLERLGSTVRPQPPLTVVESVRHDVTNVLAHASFVVMLDRVGDPGNLGTIMRSAEAAGADAVVLTPGSVDPYNPKVVRSSAGAIFHVPVSEATFDDVVAGGLRLVGTSSHAFPDRTVARYTDADLTGRIALVMGNEAAGLPDEWNDEVGPIGRWVTIPHAGRTESLNVAMAATVLAFEAARQRSV